MIEYQKRQQKQGALLSTLVFKSSSLKSLMTFVVAKKRVSS